MSYEKLKLKFYEKKKVIFLNRLKKKESHSFLKKEPNIKFCLICKRNCRFVLEVSMKSSFCSKAQIIYNAIYNIIFEKNIAYV